MKKISKLILALLAALALNVVSTRAAGPVRNANIFPVLDFVVDRGGAPLTPASDPGTKLYNARYCDEHPPILAPDGHQLTLGEWLTAKGRASVKCINKGTQVVIEMSGLIPNGVYSIWYVSLDKDGNPT